MQQQERKAVAAEVLEMGEQLFTLALEAQDSSQLAMPDEGMQEQQALPQAEIAAASAEFFAALRLLLDITEE